MEIDGLEKVVSGEVTNLVISPKRKKSKTGRANVDNVEIVYLVAEVDAAFRKSLWHRDFNYC